MPRKSILDRIKRLSQEKNQFILDQLAKLESMISASAFKLSDVMIEQFLDQLDIVNGEISSSGSNVAKVNLIDKAWKIFQQQQGVQIITVFVSDLAEITRLGKEYYTELVPDQVKGDQVESIIHKKLGLVWEDGDWSPKAGGYIDSLIKDRKVMNDLKKIAYNNIMAKQGPAALRKAFDNYIIGKDGDPGDYESYLKQLTTDTYSQVDRLNSSMHADRLGLTFFLFNGGVIRDSREFCKERHGKCFSLDEAEQWRGLIGKYKMVPGKRKAQIKVPIGPIVEDKETYDPVTDLGGIQCRHSADFISDKIAEDLRRNQNH